MKSLLNFALLFFLCSVVESHFNTSRETKFIIHGFGSSCSRVWPKEMRLSFLAVVSETFETKKINASLREFVGGEFAVKKGCSSFICAPWQEREGGGIFTARVRKLPILSQCHRKKKRWVIIQ